MVRNQRPTLSITQIPIFSSEAEKQSRYPLCRYPAIRTTQEHRSASLRVTINEAEADTVREIAEQYLSGKSLKAIAEMLTAKHIEYMSGKTDWNRSRIKRIVEDKR